MSSSEWLIISFLAVLKSGAAYMPLDPDYPAERLNHFLEESQAEVHLTLVSTSHLFESRKGKVIQLDTAWQEIKISSKQCPISDIAPENLAYIIYTSGSTGTTKGVLQTHQCLANFVEWQVLKSGIESGLNVMQFAALSFDVSVQEILFTLCSGGCLFLITNALRRDLNRLSEFIIKEKIWVIDIPFSVFNVLLNTDDCLHKATYLRHIISAGEPLLMTTGVKRLITLSWLYSGQNIDF